MKESERRYALGRVGRITAQHEERIRRESKEKEVPQLTDEQKLELIRHGRAKLQRERAVMSRRGGYTYESVPSLFDVFDFPGEADITKRNQARLLEESARLSRLRDESRALQDQLMLGDGEQALEKIQAFAEKEF